MVWLSGTRAGASRARAVERARACAERARCPLPLHFPSAPSPHPVHSPSTPSPLPAPRTPPQVAATHTVLVRFDRQHAYGDKEEVFKELGVRLRAMDTPDDFLLAYVGVQEYVVGWSGGVGGGGGGGGAPPPPPPRGPHTHIHPGIRTS